MAGNTIGTAYLQIVPSTEGIGSSIAQSLSGSTGSSIGQGLGTSIATAIKGAIVAAGVGDAIKNSISEGADLEQSIGGIKKLFGDAFDTVKANADQAFSTAGLSANDYMEQVTRFSATLIAGLSGDTQEAAQYADVALRDMSDNANTFGTNISEIQNAYQGFAKQNYTMLDNLRLGYGGTQSEMARLVNESGVLGDAVEVTAESVKEVPFDQIIQAIHVTQERVGILGTTTAEAAETFSGSFASMQAAAKNLMANAALGEDIVPSLKALGETVKNFVIDNLFPMIENLFNQLPDLAQAFASYIGSNVDVLAQAGADLIQALAQGVIASLPYLVPVVGELAIAFAAALVNADWGKVAVDVMAALGDAFASNPEGAIVGVVLLASKLAGGFVSAFGAGIGGSGLASAISAAFGGLSSALGPIIALLTGPAGIAVAIAAAGAALVWFCTQTELGKALLESVVTWAQGAFQVAAETIGGAVDSIRDVLSSFGDIIGTSVLPALSGLVDSVSTSMNGFLSAVVTIGASILQWFTDLPTAIATAVGSLLGTLAQAGQDLITGLMTGINTAWATVSAWLVNLGTLISTTVGSLLSALLAAGADVMAGLLNGITGAWGTVSSWLAGLSGKISGAVGSLGSALVNAGKAVMEGLLSGITAAWGNVASFLSSVAGKIQALKGPLTYDKKILVPAGRAIMVGLGKGIAQGFGGVAEQITDVTEYLAGASFPAPTISLTSIDNNLYDSIYRQTNDLAAFLSRTIAGPTVEVGDIQGYSAKRAGIAGLSIDAGEAAQLIGALDSQEVQGLDIEAFQGLFEDQIEFTPTVNVYVGQEKVDSLVSQGVQSARYIKGAL